MQGMRFHNCLLPPLLVTVLLVIVMFLAVFLDASVKRGRAGDTYQALACAYINSRVANWIFNPDFLRSLAPLLERGTLSRQDLQAQVEKFNRGVDEKGRHIAYADSHYTVIASLVEDETDHVFAPEVDTYDVRWLSHWWNFRLPGSKSLPKTSCLQTYELAKLNPEQDDKLAALLHRLSRDPMADRLLRSALQREISIRPVALRGHAAYCAIQNQQIRVDHSVLQYEFKMKHLVHELVHAVNPHTRNSIVEETLAEVLAIDVQDRITGVPIGCHPYVVLVDRLLDPVYSKLPLQNRIVEHLREAGVELPTQLELQDTKGL